MNYLHMLAFAIYVLCTLISGVGIISIFRTRDKLMEQRSLFLGEVFLLGNILIVGELVTLSLLHLYYGPILWVATLANLLFLCRQETRNIFKELIAKKIHIDPALVIFALFFLVFTFRNCFPLMDNDSHSTYIWMQKLTSAGSMWIFLAINSLKIFRVS